MNPPRRYLKFFPELGYWAVEKSELRRRPNRVAFNIGYGDHGDVLATDLKRGFWYFSLRQDDHTFYGPFRSAQEARRAFDRHPR